MPRPVGYGRPGTKVIPDGWAAAHAKVVADTLDCLVVIGPPGGTPDWNEDAKATLTLPAIPAYTGAASVTPQVEDGSQNAEVAQDVVPLRAYEVKIRRTATGVEHGHVVTIVTSPDPELPTGRRLKVTTVEKGSRRFSRVLQAVDAD